MIKRLVLALLVVIALLLIVPAIARSPQLTSMTPQPTLPLATPTLALTQAPDTSGDYTGIPDQPPLRDLYALAARFDPDVKTPIPPVVNKDVPQHTQGQRQVFSMTDLDKHQHYTVSATLRQVSPHAYFYVEDGADVSDDEISRGADDFEDIVFPSDRKYFGSEWLPGVDNDMHLTILLAKINGAAGYFSYSDEYPKTVYPYSNEREMIYIGLPGVRPGTRSFTTVLTHEFEHAIQWYEQPDQEAWINEGMAELAISLAGYAPGFVPNFVSAPDLPLTNWGDDAGGIQRYYGGAYLFMKYFFQHYGGFEAIKDFLAVREPGTRGISSYLEKKGYGVDFDSVFKDWVVANYLDETGNGRYSYPDDRDIRVAVEGTMNGPGDMSATVNQYGTDYYEIDLPSGDAAVQFQGDSSIGLISGKPHSGKHEWWSNRGDSIDSRLTKEFDLSGVRNATLDYWIWYDIEEGWDYAYVEVSTDGGTKWTPLQGRYTTKDNPTGNSFGDAYTGQSGKGNEPEWVEESIDLSPYAGKKVLVRFEYVTDEGVNKSGVAVDDISVPEIKFHDDAETDAGWKAEGFVRSANVVKQKFAVQIIKMTNSGNSVENMALNDEQSGQVNIRGFGKDLKKAVLAISGLTPVSNLKAGYRFSVTPAQ